MQQSERRSSDGQTSCSDFLFGSDRGSSDGSDSERPLPQWLTGVIALSAFLFLAFVSFLVKKAWCDESSRKTTGDSEAARENEFVMTNGNMYDTTLDTGRKRTMDSDSETEDTYETTLDMVRSKEDRNAYDNRITDDKVTSM